MMNPFRTKPITINLEEILMSFEDGNKPMPKIFDDSFTHKFYQMDPNTEDMIPNGRYLVKGMKVLTANPDNKIDLKKFINMSFDIDDRSMHVAQTSNRWCTVSNIGFIGDVVSFIGTYEDGTKMARQAYVIEPWYVKSETMPANILEKLNENSEQSNETMTPNEHIQTPTRNLRRRAELPITTDDSEYN